MTIIITALTVSVEYVFKIRTHKHYKLRVIRCFGGTVGYGAGGGREWGELPALCPRQSFATYRTLLHLLATYHYLQAADAHHRDKL